MVVAMLACVTRGSVAPGVQAGSGSVSAPPPRAVQWAGSADRSAAPVAAGGGVASPLAAGGPPASGLEQAASRRAARTAGIARVILSSVPRGPAAGPPAAGRPRGSVL